MMGRLFFPQAQLTVLYGHRHTFGHHIDLPGPHRRAVLGHVKRQGRMMGEHLVKLAWPVGAEVGDDHERHAAFIAERLEELFHRLDPAGGRANTDDQGGIRCRFVDSDSLVQIM